MFANKSVLSMLMGALVLSLSACSDAGGRSDQQKTDRADSLPSPPSFFYRMKADFILKETGEPISFDYVAACGYTSFKNAHTTATTFAALAPLMMFQPAGDGHAIGITTIDMCGGDKWQPYTSGPQKGEARMPDDLRPLAIWFDDIEDLSQGWGYKTDDAYESPLAKIEFVEASVKMATVDEWKAWRKQAEADYEQIGALPGPHGYTHTGPKTPQDADTFGWVGPRCPAQGAVRLKDEWIEAVFSLERYADAEYVYLEDIRLNYPDLYDFLYGFPNAIFANGTTWLNYRKGRSAGDISSYGTLTRSGGGHIDRYSGPDGTAYREVYPIIPRSVEMAGTETPQEVYYERILISPEYMGFGFCYSGLQPLDRLNSAHPASLTPTGERWPAFDRDALSKKYVVKIGETEISGTSNISALKSQTGVKFIARDGRLFFRDM